MTNLSVIRIKESPKLKNPHITKGVTSEDAAQRWAARMGAGVVYWNASEEKAYCPRIVTIQCACYQIIGDNPACTLHSPKAVTP